MIKLEKNKYREGYYYLKSDDRVVVLDDEDIKTIIKEYNVTTNP